MSAALDTINAFSSTLSGELAAAVKEQDAATVDAFENIGKLIADARQTFLDRLGTIEDAFNTDVRASLDKRAAAMKDNGAALDHAFANIVTVIDEVKARYA